MMRDVIRVKDVSKSFGDETVLHHISYDFKEGRIYGIVGNNGSGKNVEIKNTSKIKYVQNMTIDVVCAETALTLKADSTTFYYDCLGSGETLKLPLTFLASAGIQEGRYDIQLNMSYDNPDAASLSSTGTVSVDIYQPLRVELEADELPDSINAGDTMNINIPALNLGKGAI